jgi:hypothetical protein
MKKTLLMAAFVVASLGTYAQTTTPTGQSTTQGTTQSGYTGTTYNEVPTNVQSTFSASFPGLANSQWEMNPNGYRTNFKQNGRDTWVSYDRQGKQTEMRTSMTMEELPTRVQTTLQKQNANYPYEVKIGNNTYYSAKVGDKDMYFDANGKALKNPKIK